MIDNRYIDILVDYVYHKKHEGEESFRTIVNNDVDNEIQYGSINYNPENVYKDKLEIKEEIIRILNINFNDVENESIK